MSSPNSTARDIKKRPTVSRKPLSFARLRPGSSNQSAYKLNKKNAAHEQMMQRFQLRRVFAEQESSSRTIVIDKAIGVKRGKSRRSFIRRILLPLFDANLRKRAIQSLASPITPDSWAYTAHGTMMLLAYHFQLLYLPFALSFYPNGSTVTANTSMVLEAVFLVDLLLNFNTAYVKQGAIVTSRAKIAQNYLRSWFAFDTLSAFPLQAIYYLATRCTDTTSTTVRGIQGALMVLRLLRVTFLEKGMLLGRVMRVASHVVEWVRYSRYSHLLAIAHLMWLVLLFAHYMACGWHLVARPHRLSESNQTLGEQYVADYYYAISLIQGQGNLTGTWGENLYSAIAIIFGSVILAIVFGNVAMLVSNFNANTTNYHRKMEAIYATMDKMDLPLQLRERVNDYYAHIWLEYEALDGNINKFQQELTHTLRIEIGLYKFMNLMVNIPFWEDCTPDFLTQIVLSLGTRVYMPDDYVIRRREIGCEMMMINLGYCKLAKTIKHAEGLPKLAGKVCAVFDDHTSNRSQPVLSPTDLSSHSRAKSFGSSEDGSDWDENCSEEDSDEDVSYKYRVRALGMRRAPGSSFDLLSPKQHYLKSMPSLNQVRPKRSTVHSGAKPKAIYVYLKPGQAFGEMSLLMNYKRQASIRAVTFVEMCILDRKSFQAIISRYPEDRRRVLTKMLESCIQKKEVPFPWEQIIEAVTTTRRNSGCTDFSRSNVIATMTAAEAAKILVKSIDVNAPDETIKYGFQSFDQTFVEEPSLRRVNSVRSKIRDTLQRTNSGANSYRSYSRRNSRMDSSRSSTCALTDTENDTSGGSSKSDSGMGQTPGSVLLLLHSMASSIGKLERNTEELKSRRCCCKCEAGPESSAKWSNTGVAGIAAPSRQLHPLRATSATDIPPVNSERRTMLERHEIASSVPIAEIHQETDGGTFAAVKHEPPVLLRRSQSGLSVELPESRALRTRIPFKRARSGLMAPSAPNVLTKVESGASVPLQPGQYDVKRRSRISKRLSSGQSSPLTDLLWKRSSIHIDADFQVDSTTEASLHLRRLKARRSMPAGTLLNTAPFEASDPSATPKTSETYIDGPVYLPRRNRGLEFGQASLGLSDLNPSCLKIDE